MALPTAPQPIKLIGHLRKLTVAIMIVGLLWVLGFVGSYLWVSRSSQRMGFTVISAWIPLVGYSMTFLLLVFFVGFIALVLANMAQHIYEIRNALFKREEDREPRE